VNFTPNLPLLQNLPSGETKLPINQLPHHSMLFCIFQAMKLYASKSRCAILSAAWLAYVIPQSTSLGLKSNTSRAQFLSAGAASFVTATTGLATNPESCNAMDKMKTQGTNNPRYIEKELEMKYGDGPDGNPRSRGVLVRRVSRLNRSRYLVALIIGYS
jgi:hypothetical protein